MTATFRLPGSGRAYLARSPSAPRPLALVLLVHGFTRNPREIIQRFAPHLLEHFVLAAPEGYNHSFNGIVCCGNAQELGLNDGALLGEIVHDLWARNPNLAQISGAFVTGFSNGGFLTSLVALRAASGEPDYEWVRAAASIGGHQYGLDIYEKAKKGQRPIPILISHGKQDKIVRFEGCCQSQPRKCCCNISEQSPRECHSVPVLFDRWRDINGCTNSKSSSSENYNASQVCLALTCFSQTETKLCVHPRGAHVLDRETREEVREFFTDVAHRLLQTASPRMTDFESSSPEMEKTEIQTIELNSIVLTLIIMGIAAMLAKRRRKVK